jgi:hypothetical protein
VNRDGALQHVGRHRRQLGPVGREDETALPARALGRDRLSNAEAAERTHRILKEDESGADSAEPRGSLEHADAVPRAAQGDRRSQSTDPCSDDDYPHRPIMPGRAPPCDSRPALPHPGVAGDDRRVSQPGLLSCLTGVEVFRSRSH